MRSSRSANFLLPFSASISPRNWSDEPKVEEKKEDEEIVIPSILRKLGNSIVDLAQNTLYEGVLDTHIDGESNVPQHVNFIVAPNHTSHIDTGLVKKALGKDVAEQTVAVAAADYWFDTKYKRAYMNNFTTLVPIERTGSLRQSLRHVTRILNEGYNALIFPEGGRQESGADRGIQTDHRLSSIKSKDRDLTYLYLGYVPGISKGDDHPENRQPRSKGRCKGRAVFRIRRAAQDDGRRAKH